MHMLRNVQLALASSARAHREDRTIRTEMQGGVKIVQYVKRENRKFVHFRVLCMVVEWEGGYGRMQ